MAKKRTGCWAEEVDEATAERVAHIIGPDSAFGHALADAKDRRQNGEDVVIVKTEHGTVAVVPRSSITNIVRLET